MIILVLNCGSSSLKYQLLDMKNEEVYDLLAGEDVYFDTSFTFDYIEDEMFLKILKKHGTDKLLFATDSPWSNSKKTADIIKGLSIPDEDKEAILAGNALRILK